MNWNGIATHEKHSNNKIAEWEEINPTKKNQIGTYYKWSDETRPNDGMVYVPTRIR